MCAYSLLLMGIKMRSYMRGFVANLNKGSIRGLYKGSVRFRELAVVYMQCTPRRL